MQTNNVNSLVSFNAIHAGDTGKAETSINPIKVKKGTRNRFLIPDMPFETLVKYTQIRNKEVVPCSRFPNPINSFEISLKFTQIRNKELVPDSRFPIISFI